MRIENILSAEGMGSRLCVRDHMRWDRHREGCTDDACMGCLPATALVGRLCPPCVSRMLDTLAVLPALVRVAAESRVVVNTVRYDRIRVDTSRGTSMPAPMNLGIDDQLNELWSTMVAWSLSIADELHVPPPEPITPSVRARHHAGFEGLPPGVSVARAHVEFRRMAVWHERRAAAVASLPSAGEWLDALLEAVKPMRARWSVTPPPRSVPCPFCKRGRLTVAYTKPMPPLAQQPYVDECRRCGHIPTVEDVDTALAAGVPEDDD